MTLDQISFESTNDVIYNIEYAPTKNSKKANSLYLVFNNVDAYINCNSTGDKYLIFAFTDKNREALEIYTELWGEIKDQIEIISDNRPKLKDFGKIKFESDDDLPLSKILNIPVFIIVVESVFKENNNDYPQVHLHECLYEYEHKNDNF